MKMSEQERNLYVEWLSIIGIYSKDFYKKMDDAELKKTYQEAIEERSE